MRWGGSGRHSKGNCVSPLVQRFERNTTGRDLIVGDIHGHFSKLANALRLVAFNPEAGDRLFSVGDLVDRGPESHRALEWLAEPWFHAIQGNHEDMAIRWPGGNMPLSNYIANGGGWNVKNPRQKQRMFAAALWTLPIAMEIETEKGLVGVVHADCPLPSWTDFIAKITDPATSKRECESLIGRAQWSRDRADKLWRTETTGVRAVVVGHTPMERMTSLGNTIYIDTGAWKGGEFCIIDAATLEPASTQNLQWEQSA